MALTDEPGGSWFVALPVTERAALHGRGGTRRYKPGTVLFHEDDLSDWVLVVNTGRVKISVTTRDGKEVVLGICGPGDLLGEMSALDAYPRSATATAIDAVEVRLIQGADFREFLAGSPGATMAFLRSMSGRLRDSDRRRVEFLALDSIGRVASRVVELAERYGSEIDGGSTRIDIPISQEELAGMSGASREAVTKALHLFRRRGWISTGRRSITVSDLEALRARGT